MVGESLSTSVQYVLNRRAASQSSAAPPVQEFVDASPALSRVDAADCAESTDVSSICSPMALVAGITQAAAAMVMRSPMQACLFENSPVSVLDGPAVDYLSPIPSGHSRFEVGGGLRLESHLHDASSHASHSSASRCSPPEAIQVTLKSAGLPRILTHKKPPMSEESGVSGWRRHQGKAESRCVSASDSISRGEDEGEAEVQGNVELSVGSIRDEDVDEPESPTTPCSTSRPPVLECPDAPYLSRTKDLSRQSSLKETKLLMTTHLKRTASIFMFDKHFEFIREIGRGSYSTVYEARDRRGGSLCAVKMSKRQFRSRDDRERYLREIQSVADLTEHPNVVKYFRGWQQHSHFYIQMELCEGGNLRTYVDSLKHPLSENKIWSFIGQVASGLRHIHSSGVLHLDIKPENIFVDTSGEPKILKIGDFGLAVAQRLWEWEDGDGAYLAPELLKEQEPSTAADMYSFGAMIFEWVTGCRLPKSGLAREGRVEIAGNRSVSLVALLKALLTSHPGSRPSAADVLAWEQAA